MATTELSADLAEQFEIIAREQLLLDTLQTRHCDHLDFSEVEVWGIQAALLAAYELGREAQARKTKHKAA